MDGGSHQEFYIFQLWRETENLPVFQSMYAYATGMYAAFVVSLILKIIEAFSLLHDSILFTKKVKAPFLSCKKGASMFL